MKILENVKKDLFYIILVCTGNLFYKVRNESYVRRNDF